MTAGRPLTGAEINSAAGQLATRLHSVMADIMKMKAVLDGYDAAGLVNLGVASTGDANIIKSAFDDMANLNNAFTGVAMTGTVPRDHRAFTKQLLGTGLF